MATTSIWSVKGWLGKLVIYVENPNKTTNPQYYEKAELTEKQAQTLLDVIDYAADPRKTDSAIHDENIETHQQFVTGINCLPATARDEMQAVKRRFGKEDGVIAYHGYQSFAPGEADPKTAHEIGIRLAKELWGEKYQVVVATHLDKENHLHNHFVVNTVSFVDGIRYHRTGKDYHDMQVASDNLCREYGLSVIENIQYGKSKHYGEWKAEQEQRPTWRGFIKADIDEAIRMSLTERQFFRHLEEKGYEIKMGKDISVRPQGKERFVRLMRNFGEEYSIENIRRRILLQYIPEKPLAEPERKTRHYRMQGSMKTVRKITGFRALYFHYCYKLGIFPKDRPQNRKRLHFLLREDLLKLNNISQEVRLLVRHKIDTAEQLSLYKNGLEVQIEKLSAERKALYKKQRTVKCQSDPKLAEAVKKEIDGLTEQLKNLRREVHLCDDIAQRSGVITEKLKAVREDEQNQGKEKQQNEPIRRRS
ncbi:MAG: relaxase/mobilization nuclease domain-containing protein [Clostridia bacterium]|nr:relaxase/mobilization nuclease domain-containing protein [Clostridia bacterium]